MEPSHPADASTPVSAPVAGPATASTVLTAQLSGQPRRIEIRSVPRPAADPGTVVVMIDRCAIDRSDLDAWRRGVALSPAWFGHQWAGRVWAIGAGVTGRFEGERVVGAACPPCGTCAPCGAGIGSSCELALAMIAGTDPLAPDHGAFAEFLRVDARRLHRIPDGLDDDDVALAEPAATALRSVVRAGLRLGDVVAVIGAGVAGQLVAQLAHLAGAGRVVVVDPDPAERELACSLGAEAAFAAGPALDRWLSTHGHGLGADLVFECSGDDAGADLALTLARPGATVVLVGVSGRSPSVAMGPAMAGELIVVAARGYDVTEMGRALQLMADDRLRVRPLVGRLVGFGGLADAFEALAAGAVRTVLFSPTA